MSELQKLKDTAQKIKGKKMTEFFKNLSGYGWIWVFVLFIIWLEWSVLAWLSVIVAILILPLPLITTTLTYKALKETP